jgi:predicted nuclease with TOPRIM domain
VLSEENDKLHHQLQSKQAEIQELQQLIAKLNSENENLNEELNGEEVFWIGQNYSCRLSELRSLQESGSELIINGTSVLKDHPENLKAIWQRHHEQTQQLQDQ